MSLSDRAPRSAVAASTVIVVALLEVVTPSSKAAAAAAPDPGALVVVDTVQPRAHFTHGWVTATIYFNRRETRDASHAGTLVGACGGLAAAVRGPAGVALASACVTQAAGIVVQANRADDRRMCLKVKMTWPPLVLPTTVVWPDIYRRGYCR